MDETESVWHAVSAIVKGWSPQRRSRYVGKPMIWHYPIVVETEDAQQKTIMVDFSAN